MYPSCAGSLGGLDSSAEHGSPGVERADPPGPSSLPIVRHRWSASTSFVLAALRALHVDPSYAVTKSAMIEEGTSSPWTWHFARTYRTPPSGRGNYGPGSPNRPTFMPGGPENNVRRSTTVDHWLHIRVEQLRMRILLRYSCRCRRRASSTSAMTCAGTRPKTGPMRSTVTERTCSA